MLRGVHDTKRVKTTDLAHPRLSENPCKQRNLLTITILFTFLEGLYLRVCGPCALGGPPLCTDLQALSHPQTQGLVLTLPVLGWGHSQPYERSQRWDEQDTHLLPATVASPEVTVVSPVSIRKVVVLPAPFTPRRPKH